MVRSIRGIFRMVFPGREPESKPIIGLAGGIGAGKSMVAGILAELGAGIVDSDALGRAALFEPGVSDVLKGWWGDAIVDNEGRVDRARVGDIVFRNSDERVRLEQLLHPRIARDREAKIAKLRADPAVRAIVLDSPLLFETGLNSDCDSVWFVEADRAARAERVATSRNWSSEELLRREKLQNPLDSKRMNADYTIINNSGIDDLRLQVVRLFKLIIDRTSHTRS